MRNKQQHLAALEAFIEINVKKENAEKLFDSTISIEHRVKSSDVVAGEAAVELERLLVSYETLFEW